MLITYQMFTLMDRGFRALKINTFFFFLLRYICFLCKICSGAGGNKLHKSEKDKLHDEVLGSPIILWLSV